MEKKMSFQQYRNIDLSIMGVLLIIAQTLILLAANSWFGWGQYIVSPMAVITALVMMRWGPWAGIHAALGGIVFALVGGGQWQHYLIYGLGNLLSLAALLFFRKGKEPIRKSAFLSVIFAGCVQLLMFVGRAGVALIVGFSPAECLSFLTSDLLSLLFTMLAIWIARRSDGLFEDQKHYLIRIQEQEQ